LKGEGVDLSDVTVIGVIAFACAKFGGYFLAFRFLKRIHPVIQASALLMASTRTVLGLIVGGALYFGWNAPSHEALPYYLLLTLLRVFIWGAIIHYFTGKANIARGKTWLYTFGGVLLSSLMDIPAAFFAFLVPGGVLFC
jgi:hypothetical protein